MTVAPLLNSGHRATASDRGWEMFVSTRPAPWLMPAPWLTIVLNWRFKAIGLPTCYLSMGPTSGGDIIRDAASEVIAAILVTAYDKIPA
ncbi:hypothetical protein F4815DRAFT_445498 [Daldinia loculata]|nr:hypothetical protein F4815DRAFT_445498 [Daldinia loculata]